MTGSNNLESWATPFLFHSCVFSCISKRIHCLPVRTKSSIFQLDRQFHLVRTEDWADWNETLTYPPVEGFCFCCCRSILPWVTMEMDKGHVPIRRGVSWSPGGLRKPLQATQNMHTPGTECNASWEKTGFNKEQMSRKTSKCLFIWRFLSLLWKLQQDSVLLLCSFITQKPSCKYISSGLFVVLTQCYSMAWIAVYYHIWKPKTERSRQQMEKTGSSPLSVQLETVRFLMKHLFPWRKHTGFPNSNENAIIHHC